MKKVFLATVVLLLSLSGIGYAATNSDNEETKTKIEQTTKPSCVEQPNDTTR